MTNLVHTQKQLNSLVATTKKNLVAQGVDVTRRNVEKAISPAVSGGQSHEVFVAQLKSEPSTTKGVAYKMIQKAAHRTAMLPKLSSVSKDLASSIENLTRFEHLIDWHKKSFITAFDSELSLSSNEVLSSISFFREMIDKNSSIEHFHFAPDQYLERNDDGLFEENVFIELHLKQGNKEIYAKALYDADEGEVEYVEVSDLVIDGVLMFDMELGSNDETLIEEYFHQVFESLIKNIGFETAVSNVFTADVSPELLKMLIAECA